MLRLLGPKTILHKACVKFDPYGGGKGSSTQVPNNLALSRMRRYNLLSVAQACNYCRSCGLLGESALGFKVRALAERMGSSERCAPR